MVYLLKKESCSNSNFNFRDDVIFWLHHRFIRERSITMKEIGSLGCLGMEIFKRKLIAKMQARKRFETRILLPTGSVKVECLPPEREIVSSSHSRVIPKTWKMVIDILSWAPSLRAISINQRGGCLVGRFCVNDSCFQMEN